MPNARLHNRASVSRSLRIIALFANESVSFPNWFIHFLWCLQRYRSVFISIFIFSMYICPSDVISFMSFVMGFFSLLFLYHFYLSSRSISHHYGEARNSAGSSSNVSSSNSNNSDGFNSLDSMENEIQHNNKNNQRRRPTVPANGIGAPTKAKSSSKTAGDSLSYLGPFNFRQLLRPIQGPTNSLRKRRSGKIWSSQPPLHSFEIHPEFQDTNPMTESVRFVLYNVCNIVNCFSVQI